MFFAWRYVFNRGVAQLGSVLEWGSRGREFESRHSDQIGLDFPSKIKTFLLQKNFAPSGLPFNLLPNLLPDLLPPPITPIRRRSWIKKSRSVLSLLLTWSKLFFLPCLLNEECEICGFSYFTFLAFFATTIRKIVSNPSRARARTRDCVRRKRKIEKSKLGNNRAQSARPPATSFTVPTVLWKSLSNLLSNSNNKE